MRSARPGPSAVEHPLRSPSEQASGGEERNPNKSLTKALRVLEQLGRAGGELGVTQLANTLDINKTTVHRLLRVLKTCGFVEQSGDHATYRLGLKLFELGSVAIQSRGLQAQARPLLVEMARRASETVHLAILQDDEVIYLEKLESRNTQVTVPSAVGRRLPAYCTGLGKVLLAHLPDSEMDEVLAKCELRRYTDNTITSLRALRVELRRIRERGYGTDDQEIERGLRCVAAPVWNHERRVIAAVSVAGPSARFEGAELESKIALVKEFAQKISTSLYYYPESAVR